MFQPVPLLRYADPVFDPEHVRLGELRVQLSEEELLIAVYDPLTQRFPVFEKYTVRAGYSGLLPHQAASRILRAHPLVRQEFRQREFIWVTHRYTLVPEALYETSSAGNLLALNHPHQAGDSLCDDVLPHAGLRIVYAIPDTWKALLSEFSGNLTEHHYLYHLLQKAMAASSKPDAVFCHVQDFRADIIVLRDQRLMLCNSFRFQTPEDFVYYLLLAYDRHQFNRDEVALWLCGEIDAGSALYASAYKYIRELRFLNRSKEPAVADPADGTEALRDHFYINLLHPAHENH